MGIFRSRQYKEEKQDLKDQKRDDLNTANTRSEKREIRKSYKDDLRELKEKYPQDVVNVLEKITALRTGMELILSEKGYKNLGNMEFIKLTALFGRVILNIPEPNFATSFDPQLIVWAAKVVSSIVGFFQKLKENRENLSAKDRQVLERTEDAIEETQNGGYDSESDSSIQNSTATYDLPENYKLVILAGLAYFAFVK